MTTTRIGPLLRRTLPGLLTLFASSTLGTRLAQADLIATTPFSIVGSPNQETITIPQFDPAQGTLNSATITVSGSMQFVLEVFDNGPGPVAITAQDTLSFHGTPLLAEGTFTDTIPTGQSIYTFMPPAVSLGTLTEFFPSDTVSFFTGTGTLPFQLSLAGATVDQFSGATAYGAFAFTGATGNVTVDYAFTPAPVPEPASLGVAGLGLIAVGAFARCKRNVLARIGMSATARPIRQAEDRRNL